MKRFSLPLTKGPSGKPTGVSHLLNLKRNIGFLPRQIDLPAALKSPDELWYLRQMSRSMVPASYRSGLVFFVMMMVFGMFGVAALDARTLATSHRTSLHSQIIEEFSKLSAGIQPYVSEEASILLPEGQEEPITKLSTFSDPLEHQSRLATLSLEVRDGYESFQDFLHHWKSDGNPLEKLRWMQGSAQKSLRAWDRAFVQLESFPFYQLSQDKRVRLQRSLFLLSELRNTLRTFSNLYDPLTLALGKTIPQRILIFIQDPHERRATGGALSAGIEILVEGGEIVSKTAFHVSDYDDRVNIQMPVPPELTNVSPEWNLLTSNSFLDARRSSEQMAWFWSRKARNSSDLIILVNSSVLDRLHTALPLSRDLEHASLRWSALRLQGDREALKAFALSALDEWIENMNDPDRFFLLLPHLTDLISEKQILMTSIQPALQKALEDVQLDGSLPGAAKHQDFLLISSVNTESNGSDRWISDDVQLHTAISESGTIRNWLQVNRKHRWENAFLSPLVEKIGFRPPTNLLSQLSSSQNNSVLKILVPKGSVIQSTVGIALTEISTTETDTHTVWAFKNSVKAGGTSTFELTYELPWRFDTQTVDNYRLHLVKQPGSNPMAFQHRMKLPPQMSVFQQLPDSPFEVWNKDERIAVVAGRNP